LVIAAPYSIVCGKASMIVLGVMALNLL